MSFCPRGTKRKIRSLLGLFKLSSLQVHKSIGLELSLFECFPDFLFSEDTWQEVKADVEGFWCGTAILCRDDDMRVESFCWALNWLEVVTESVAFWFHFDMLHVAMFWYTSKHKQHTFHVQDNSDYLSLSRNHSGCKISRNMVVYPPKTRNTIMIEIKFINQITVSASHYHETTLASLRMQWPK